MKKLLELSVFAILLTAGCEKQEDPYFLLESGAIHLIVSKEGGYGDYTVLSNGRWKLIRIPLETWLEAVPSVGNGNGGFQIAIEPNTSGSERIVGFSITLNGSKLAQEIVVTQRGGDEKDEDITAIDLGNKREIFVDSYLINRFTGTSLVLHHPVDEGPVLFFDKPWEGAHSGYVTIIKENDIFRVYYRGLSDGWGDGTDAEVTCFAQSNDGVYWEKPNLKIYPHNGSLDNNIILANAAPVMHNFSPFLDSNPQTLPSQKYKAVGGIHSSGLIAYVSADGIHWMKLREESILRSKEFAFDSQNVVFWSESEKCYLCYFRTWSLGGFRTVSRATSTDFVNWTEPEAMTFGDTPMEHLYTNQTSPYFRAPHIYIAIGGRFMPDRQVLTDEQAKELNVDPDYYKDCSDAFLMSSRGGNVYNRTFMDAFIRPGIGMENWISRSNYPALNVVQTGPAEMSVYVNQDNAQPTAHLRRYSLRLDGFASLAASYNGGEAITKPFTFSGSELEINYSTSAAGEIRFEIQDVDEKPIPGFSLEESAMIIGNEISRIVQWESGKNLTEMRGKPVRLRIVMKDADLFSFRFKD